MDISETLTIPDPHPMFSIPIAPTLADWSPKGDPNFIEPTREQLDRGISLMMHIVSEAGLQAVTSYQAGRICKDTVAQYSLQYVQDSPHAALLYQGLPFWRTECLKVEGRKGATEAIIPSKEAEQDISGTLPKIPVASNQQTRKISERIEGECLMSKGVEDVWDTLKIMRAKEY